MGQEIVYCNTCGLQVLSSEFEKGKAVTVLGRNYCLKCMAEIVERERLKRAAGAKRSSSAAPLEQDHLPSPIASEARTETRRVPKATTTRWLTRRASSLKVMLIIGAIVTAVVVLLLVAVLSRSYPN